MVVLEEVDQKVEEILAENDDDYEDIIDENQTLTEIKESSEDDELAAESEDDEVDLDVTDETVLERIQALADIIPPVTRAKMLHSLSDAGSWAFSMGQWVGSGLWILSTASLMALLPLALELERERALIDQEHQQRVQQQQAQQVNDFLISACIDFANLIHT